MGIYDKSFYNRDTPAHIVHKYRKLEYQDKIKGRREYKLNSVIADMMRVGNNLNIPRMIIEHAITIFKKGIKELPQLHLSTLYHYAFASLLIAIREGKNKAPVTIPELHNEFYDLGITIKVFKAIRIAHRLATKLNIKYRTRDPSELVYRAINDLLSSREIQRRLKENKIDPELYRHNLTLLTLKFLKVIEDEHRGLRPLTKVAVMIYLADKVLAKKLKIHPILSQKLIEKNIGTSGTSIRNYTSEYMEKLQKIIS